MFILTIIGSLLLGIMLSVVGVDIFDWEFWAFIVSGILIGVGAN